MKKETSITNLGSQKQEFRRHSLAGDTAYLDLRYCFVLKRSGRVLEPPQPSKLLAPLAWIQLQPTIIPGLSSKPWGGKEVADPTASIPL